MLLSRAYGIVLYMATNTTTHITLRREDFHALIKVATFGGFLADATEANAQFAPEWNRDRLLEAAARFREALDASLASPNWEPSLPE